MKKFNAFIFLFSFGFYITANAYCNTHTKETIVCEGNGNNIQGDFHIQFIVIPPENDLSDCRVLMKVRYNTDSPSSTSMPNVYGDIDLEKIDLKQWNWDLPQAKIYAKFNVSSNLYEGRYEDPLYPNEDANISCK